MNEYSKQARKSDEKRKENKNKEGEKNGPRDKEGVAVGSKIGVSEDRRALWECRSLNPYRCGGCRRWCWW